MDGGEAYQLTTSKEASPASRGRRTARASRSSPSTRCRRSTKRSARGATIRRCSRANFRLSHVWVVDVATKQRDRSRARQFHGERRAELVARRNAARLSRRRRRRCSARRARTPTSSTLADKRIEEDLDEVRRRGSPPAWSPDGKTIAYTMLPQTHTRARRQHLGRADRQRSSGALRRRVAGDRRTSTTPKADVSAGNPQWTPDGKRILFTTGERAYNAVYAYDVATGKLTRVVDKMLIRGTVAVEATDSTVAFAMGTPNAPADVYVSDLDVRVAEEAHRRQSAAARPRARRDGSRHVEEHRRHAGRRHSAQARRLSSRTKVSAARRSARRPDRRDERRLQGELGIAGTGVGGPGLGGALPESARQRRTTARSSRARTSWTGAAATTATS